MNIPGLLFINNLIINPYFGKLEITMIINTHE